ncbi:MAG: class I SAM-dependent methyltransferase [Solirubrobacterales bacterium]
MSTPGQSLPRRVILRSAQRIIQALEEQRFESVESIPPSLREDEVPSPAPTDGSATIDRVSDKQSVEQDPVAEPPPGAPGRFERNLAPGNFPDDRQSVSRMLYERLSQGDLSAVESAIGEHPELATMFAEAATIDARVPLVLSYGMWLCHPAVIAKTGLSAEQPPESIHAMARGPLAAAGGLYEADFVVNALASAGINMANVRTTLDFGCSSGRVVRVLQAAYPEARWHACDPNQQAIEWAQRGLPGIEFFINGDEPPLPLDDGSLDLAYAISIWSHFEPQLGLRWFEEMHRLIRPDGHLVCTTHGPTSIAFYATRGLRTLEQSQEILDSLYRQGWWYAPEFGEEGDWGVVNPDWGTAFLSPEWILTQLCPRWRVLEFAPGRNQDNQDVYVLQRV